MFVFRGNSRTFRCSAVWKGLKRVSSVNFRTFFSARQLLPCSFFVVILVLFGVLQWSWTGFFFFYNKTRAFLTFLALQHPAQELKSSFRANFSCFFGVLQHPAQKLKCSQRMITHSAHIEWPHIEWSQLEWSHIECSHRVVTHRVVT